MDFYIFMVVGYAVLLGLHNVFKKKATLKHRDSTVLVLFTGVCFLLSLIWIPFGVSISSELVWVFVLKGFILALGWFFILKILKSADVSLVSLSMVLASIITLFAGVFLFGESMSGVQIVGVAIAIIGVFAINVVGYNERKKIEIVHIVVLIIYAIISSISAIIDKYTADKTSFYQVQFWFILFLFAFSLIFFAIDRCKEKRFLVEESDFKNYWIYLVAITLFVGDCLLFLSYRMPNASLVTITVVSKLKTIIGAVVGVFVFKEKNIIAKIIISLIVVAGIIMVSLG
jgi:transporter family protein